MNGACGLSARLSAWLNARLNAQLNAWLNTWLNVCVVCSSQLLWLDLGCTCPKPKGSFVFFNFTQLYILMIQDIFATGNEWAVVPRCPHPPVT